MSGVSAESIGYMEAHGTGTILGDPIEISALTQVFRASTERRGYLRDRVGEIKFRPSVLRSRHRRLDQNGAGLEKALIPPTVHYYGAQSRN